MTTSQQPTSEHEIFGPYEVYERLGVGGMATVHRAKENGIEGFERIVALKRLLPHLAEDASFVRSFVREAKLASMLQHANIVQLYELGRVGPVYFISMEHIDGKDIRKILRQARRVTGPPPLSVFLSLMIQLCDALDYAHRRCDQNGEPLGLVHRDVSPSNLLVTESGHLKVIDFGIARAQSQHLRTQTGRIKGKLAYMAPEALKGQELDARSDIFSCGVIAHELLTARPLFATKNEYETLLRVQRGEVAIPSTINSSCPPELDDMVLKALARDPSKRWGSAAELRDALHYLRAQYQVSATNREVCTWMEWAFTREAADTRSFAAVTTGVSEPISVVSGSYSSAPQNAFAPSRATTIRLGSVATALEPEAEPLPPPPVSSGVPLVRGDNDDSGDEEAVEFAWGCQEEEGGEPLLLDEVPDVSRKLVAAELPSSSRRASSEFGSAIVHERHRRTMRMAMVAGILALAVASLSVYLVVSTSGDAGSGDLAASHTASIKFAIEPADATIDILGYGVHDGSPYKLEVQAPGTYRIQVKRDGYKSYVTELEVDSGESHVVRVALDTGGSDKAQVTVRSTPAGHIVFIDGVASERRTPANLELAPGAHVISIKDDGDRELWQHEFTASGNTQYEFHPELLNEDKQRRREERRMSEHRSLAQPDPARPARRAEQAVVEIPVVAEPAMREPQELTVVASISAGSRSALDSLATPTAAALEVPKAPPPVANRGPVTIPPNLARKRSGEMPRLPKVSSGEVPSHASAKLCIDSKGRVSSATVLTPMPNSIKLALRRSLELWRYAPYEEGGEAVGACFAVNFKIAN